ncbi:hypothetical protein CAPTEDRAFT_219540 [Capitella teleta]|uniref:Fibronectin type-III domain-containing protein n=1 Tax=Capitella teleta TaxID=283909 RepID=R7TGN6_CAPTE|nr:hypothetical protein CAPTEDRAFT_219540 [Capitella teleta]|eukprot:ELT90741.1 hypothetical protein CAPTEDRAFT_219540 [Capitella teleta]
MGAGASAEEDEGSSANMPPTHSEPRPGPSSRPPRPESTSGRSLTGTNSQNSWRAAMLSASLAQSTGRKMRAAALGRKSACTVQIAKGGFSLQHIQICEGQVITFQWEDFEGKGFNVTQVFHDGEQYKPVVGGYNSGPLQLKGFFEQQFNMRGEFKFVSAGLRVTPLTVEVFERKDIKCNVSDAGFEPKIIRVDEGNFVHWSWAQCSVPRSVIEMKYSHKSGTLVQKESQQRALVTKAGNSRKEFNKPGLFYFQTEGAHPGEMYTCLVHVRERQREFRIEIMDQNFDPPILVIDEGDRVWWHWEKDRCQKLHCVYQIDPPELNHPLDESFKPKKHGFRYPAPSRAGLLSMEFFEPGIYYYSDHNFEEAAEYIGTVIVKPKQVEHFVELTAEGFNPDLVYAKAGDRLWWTWFADEVDHMFQITEVEKCVSPIASRPAIENESQGEGSYMDDELEQLKVACGLETAQLGSVGVYHFRVSDSPNNISTCSVISNGGPRNHTVHITDKGFEPKVVTIHPGDRVWWVWQESKKQHNVIQVSHQGNHIADGFCSGAPVDSPCAFMHQFDLLGVFYYISDSLNKAFGAVVVASQPVVHEVQVTGGAICPDPLPISVNDVVAWTFRGLRQSDVQEITSVDKVLDAQHNSPTVAPRSVGQQTSWFLMRGDDLRVSSVLVDEINDSAVVRVNNHGFHPEKLTISKGQSVLWQWKEPGSEEAHNIIHVNPPNSDAPLSVIQGTRSFNSGRPTPQNSFLYTFDDPGTYCVASQGSPGYAGTVCVIEEENKAALPYISSDFKEGSVDKFHQVLLAVDTHQANIYYTLDGSIPAPFKATSKVYDPSKGVVLKRSGLGFIRALAVAENKTNSGVYTSGRFWVLSGDEDRSESEHEPEPAAEDNSARWHWWNCVPTIKAVFTQPGVMEVFWDSPPSASKHMIKAYQLFLNGVSYCELFPPIYTSVNVAGLAGGRLYEVSLEVHPTDKMFLPHKSNKLMMKCVQTTSSGGPVISLERAAKPDTLSIVWMSISTEHNPIEGYKVYMNGQMCGNQVVPDSTSDRCKVVIEGCQMDFVYRIVVAAVPSDGSSHKMSNELEVTLPLDVEHITLPPAETRLEDEDLYKEYIEVRESGDKEIIDEIFTDDTADQELPPTIDLTASNMHPSKKRGRTSIVTMRLISPRIASGSKQAIHIELNESDSGFESLSNESFMIALPDKGITTASVRKHYYVHNKLEIEKFALKVGEELVHIAQHSKDCKSCSRGVVMCAGVEKLIEGEELGVEHLDEALEVSLEEDDHDEEGIRGVSSNEGESRPSTAKAPLHQVVSVQSSPYPDEEQTPPPPPPAPAPQSKAPLQRQRSVAAAPLEPRPPSSSQKTSRTRHVKGAAATAGAAAVLAAAPPLHVNMSYHDASASQRYSVHPDIEPSRPPLPHSHYTQQATEQAEEMPQDEEDEDPGAAEVEMCSSSEEEEQPPMIDATGMGEEESEHYARPSINKSPHSDPDDWRQQIRLVPAEVSHTPRTMDCVEEDHDDLFTYHYEVDIEDDLPDLSPQQRALQEYFAREEENKKHKKRQPKTAVVAVKEEAHLSAAPDPPAQPPGPAAEATPVVSQNDSSQLPAPMVSAVSQDDAVLITWHFKRSPGELYNLLVNVVNIVGPKFQKTVNSDISFECMQEVDGEAVAGIQHCWNVTTGNQCVVRGLEAGLEYSIYVVANYALANARQPTEIQAKSAAIKYATIGPPGSVKLRVKEADLSEVTLQWSTPSSHSDVKILGYQVTVDGSPLGKPLPPNITQTSIDNLQAGKSIMVAVTTLSEHPIGNSQPSNSIRVTAPSPPDAPYISEQPSHKKNAVIVAWQKPEASEHAPYGEDIVAYRVFLDGKWHGEVKATAAANRNGYQYYITELEPGQTYDVCVRSYAGQSKVDPHSQQAFCVTEGPVSNTIPIACAAPPKSPILRVEGMNSEGISVHWELPQQYGEAAVSGFQMLKDGNLYGSIIPPDVHTLCIKGLSLGDVTELQILALTEHPVGRGAETVAPNKELDELFNGEHYAGCKPGPKLRVHYTGLVQAPTRVWCENITGHSAVIVWSKDDRLSQHYIAPESYQVTWWPGNKADSEISSQSTKEDHMLITALKPNTKYTVVVEARKMQHYAEVDRHGAPPSEHDGYHNTCILTGACEAITLQTARPPDPATNLSIVGTTCQSIQINWDQPKEHGCEVIGIRVDAVPMKESEEEGGAKHCCAETVPDAAGAIIDNLKEKTEYLITITAITDEFFENLQPGHQLKSSRVLPRDQVPPESEWLPCASIIGMTSGTDGPTDVRVVKTSIDSVTLTWKNPKVHGSNIKRGTVLRWAECRLGQAGFTTPSSNMAHHKNLEGDVNQAVIEGLHPGILYKFCVEAVVSVKTTLQSGHHDPDFEMKNRRTTHVMSKPVFVRTRAPCEPPLPWVTGYTSNTCKMHWEKPLLYRTFGKDDDGNTKYLKLSLEGYRLEINGKPHMRLAPTAQSCTLIKCKPGKTYRIVLVALTCTEEVKRERKRKGCDSQLLQESSFSMTDGANREWQTISDDFENDEAASKALVVTLPKLQDGFLKEKSVVYVEPKVKLNREDEEKDIGDIAVKWQIQGTHDQIKQFNVSWKNLKDKDVQTKVLDAGVTKCTLPVTSRKTLYDIVVEAQFEDEVVAPFVEHVQCLVPGPPDNPVIWLRAIESNEFVIEWAEPRLYGFKCAGYQIYLNGKKVGNSLNSHHRKAVVPCKAKRHYKVNLRALSANERYPDSDLSNSLQVSTGNHPLHMNFIGNEEDLTAYGDDESELVLKIVRITEAAIHLDWSQYTEIPGMTYYRVVWSSVAQPAEREVKLPAGEKSCVIHKCFPGTNHFVRVYSMQAEDRVLDRSRLTTIQTSAPPDPPNVTQRACNFKYVAIEWQKPATYGDAGVTGYKVIVNGVVDATLGPDQCTYSFAGGNWCKEYAFQVQALTATDRLCSRPSDPLVVSWPGVQPPLLFKAPPVSSNSMKVKWETPPATEGVKIKQYKLIVMEEETERPIQIIAPIHPDSTEAEIHNLKAGSYLAYLEVHVHGSSEVVKSDVLRLQPTISPDAPVITVTVVGLDERRAIEKVTANLINKRDWLLSFLSGRENSSPTHHDEHQYTTMKEKLQAVDAMLDDCLEALSQYTGHLLAHVSWTCVQSNPDLVVSGYKVLVDGKQYGTTLHPNVKNIRLKLGLSQPIHQISMVAVSSDKPHASSSLESNVVEVFTEPFRPYSFYTFLSQCPRAGKGMGPAYQEALAIERKTCQMVNLGLLKHPVSPVPAATLMDIFEGEYRPLFPPSGPRAPAMLLFWGQWCHSSRKLISWFVKFARMNASNFEFVAVHCSKTQVTMSERLELVNLITANGWREDKCVRHVTNHSLNQSHLQRQSPGHDCFSYLRGPPVRPGSVGIDARGDKARNSEKLSSTDLAELLHVPGVPSTLVVHPNGTRALWVIVDLFSRLLADYVAWKGRYAAFDFAAYEHAMKYIAAQVLGQSAPLPDPWDVNIDDVSMSKQITNRPLSNSSPAAMIHLNGTTRPNSSRRPLSAKQQRLFVKTNKHRTGGAGGASGGEKKISVSTRPYSAPKFSPYMEKVSSPHHRRASSGKKNKPLSSS